MLQGCDICLGPVNSSVAEIQVGVLASTCSATWIYVLWTSDMVFEAISTSRSHFNDLLVNRQWAFVGLRSVILRLEITKDLVNGM